MTNDIPSGTITNQSQTSSPLAGYTDALVDDTVVLVDGAATLTGSPSTPITPQRTIIKPFKPDVAVRTSR